MRLFSIIRVFMHEREVLTRPDSLERVRRALSRSPECEAAYRGASVDAATVVEAHRRALADVGANDAIALIVDDLILFEDRDRRPDDLGDLLLAFREYAPAIDADYRVLRLTAEHLDAGIHYVIELQAYTRYPQDEAPVRIIISARLAELRPRSRETAREYNVRVVPLLQDGVALQSARDSFDRFTLRMRDAFARAMPDTNAAIVACEPTTAVIRRDRETQPDKYSYDPYEEYHPNPRFGIAGMARLGALTAGRGAAPATATFIDDVGADVDRVLPPAVTAGWTDCR